MTAPAPLRKRHLRLWLLTPLFLLPPVSDALAESTQVNFQDTGAQLGWGWDSTLEEAKPNVCVEFEPASEGAQTVNMSINEVSSQSELLEKMDLSATASVKAMVSIEGKASFAKEVSVNSSSSSFLVRAAIDNGYDYTAPAKPGRAASPPRPSFWTRLFGGTEPAAEDAPGTKLRLTPWALKLAQRPDNLASFRNQCGDSFIQAIYGGAELYGLVTIESSTRDASEKFSEEVSGSYSFFQASEKFESDIRAIDTNATINVTFFQLGGSGGAIASDRQGFVDKLKGLTREAADNPKHTRIAVMPYARLANWPTEPGPQPEEHELNQILVEYWNFTSLYRDVQQVLAHQDKYLLGRGVDAAGLRQLEDDLNGVRLRLERMARDNASLPEQVTSLPIAERRLASARSLVKAHQKDQSDAGSPALVHARTLLRLAENVQTLDKWKPDINWFKVRMPLPLSAVKKDDYQDPELRRWIVDWYIGRLSRRQCDLSPSARGCLSNAELAKWEDRVILDDGGFHYGEATGAGGGEQFDDGHNWRVRESRLRKIIAYPFQLGKDHTPLFGLEFFYDNADGTTFSTGLHGDTVDRTRQTFQLEPDEYLVKTELHILDDKGKPGNIIDGISFTTNKGRVFDPYKSAGFDVKTKDVVMEYKQWPLLAYFGQVCKAEAGDGRDLIWLCQLGPVYKFPEKKQRAS